MMSRYTGRAIDESTHIHQSIDDILNTPIGSRIARREYGSLNAELIDQPFNDATKLRLMASSIMAIRRWEPRVNITSVTVGINFEGRSTLEISTTRRGGQRSGRALNFSVMLK